MAAMRRLVLLALLLAAATVLLPGTAHASAPCRDRIYNEWYRSGKIASTYPLACYRDALRHVPSDAAIYSSLKDDIQSALQAAVDRAHGKKVPAEVGHGLPPASSSDVKNASLVKTAKGAKHAKGSKGSKASKTVTDGDANPPKPLVAAAVASTTSGGGGGLPVPILVLGGVALLLAAVGAVGAGLRYFRR